MDPEVARMLADLGNAHREFISAPPGEDNERRDKASIRRAEDERLAKVKEVSGDGKPGSLQRWNSKSEHPPVLVSSSLTCPQRRPSSVPGMSRKIWKTGTAARDIVQRCKSL